MIYGRPAAIPEDYVKLELPKSLNGDNDLATNSVRFFNSTM